MEEEKDDYPTTFAWWSDSHNRPNQSHWLQATLSDLDNQTKMIVSCIQGDGDSFTKRAEMFFKRRPQLIKMVQDLFESYCSLAQKYDLLRSEHYATITKLRSPSSSSSLNSFKQVNDSNNALQVYESDLVMNGTEVINGNNIGSIDCLQVNDCQESEEMWNQVRQNISTLIDDNLRQQIELIRRNDEKREVIKQLRAQVGRLMEENRALKSYLPSYKVEMKSSQSHASSKLKGLDCIGKFKSSSSS